MLPSLAALALHTDGKRSGDVLERPEPDLKKRKPEPGLLLDAAKEGNLEHVRKLLDDGAQVDKTDISNSTALMKASAGNYFEIVKLLLDRGAQVDKADNAGWTALNYANTLAVVKLLLDAGANPNNITAAGTTVLMKMSIRGHVGVVQLLLKRGARVNIMSNHGQTALTASVGTGDGNAAVVELLLKYGANVDEAGEYVWTPLQTACREGYVDNARVLLNYGADVDKNVNENRLTPLMYASEHNHVNVINLLLDRGANINKTDNNGWTALVRAGRQYSLAAVKVLLERGADLALGTKAGRVLTNMAWPPLQNLIENAGSIRTRYLLRRWRTWFRARAFWRYWYFRAVGRVYAPNTPAYEESLAEVRDVFDAMDTSMSFSDFLKARMRGSAQYL